MKCSQMRHLWICSTACRTSSSAYFCVVIETAAQGCAAAGTPISISSRHPVSSHILQLTMSLALGGSSLPLQLPLLVDPNSFGTIVLTLNLTFDSRPRYNNA